MSQQALSKAGNKFNHTPFLKIFRGVRDAFYVKENITALEKFEKILVIAIDSSEIALPNIPNLRKKFGGTGSKTSSPTARASIAYDVLNDSVMDASFTSLAENERTLAAHHIENVGKIIDLKEALFIMDRGYPCEKLIRQLSEESNYLMRLRSKFNTEIDSLPLGSHTLILYNDVDVRIVKLTWMNQLLRLYTSKDGLLRSNMILLKTSWNYLISAVLQRILLCRIFGSVYIC